MRKRIAIVLSGCGVQDGSEIHEAVLTLLAVVKAGAEPHFFAPAGPQAHVVNHLTGKAVTEERSMLVEAARIARGNIKDLRECKVQDIDAVIFPGGFGAALNLCDFGAKGAACKAHPEVERVVQEMHRAKKPQGFICIAPAIAARVLGASGVGLTIGTDAGTAAKLEAMGARHFPRKVDEVYCDEQQRIVSTPAYMSAENVAEAEAGISELVKEVLRLVSAS